MKLRKPCQHGRYERHDRYDSQNQKLVSACPGGVFLPDDTLVIERSNETLTRIISTLVTYDGLSADDRAVAILDALSVQEAE